MKDFKKLLKFMEGYRIIYLFGMISILISQILTTVTPLILRTTIDSIIGDEVIKSSIIQRIVYFLGGKEFLKQHLWLIGLLLVCIAILRGLFLYLKNTLSSKSAENTTKKIRDKLYDHIQRLPYEYHVKAETGELIQKCTSDVDTIRRFLAIQLVEVVGSIFMLVFIIYVMFTMNIKMTMVSIIILPITFLFSFIFFTKIKKAFESSDEAEARMTTTLQENLTGVRVVKAFSRQRYEVDKFDKKNLEYQNLTYKLIKNLSAYWAISDFLSMCQVAFVVIIGSYLAYKGELSLGVFVAFISYINMIIWPVRQMGRTLTDMGKAFVSLQRIEKIFEEPIELLDENNNKQRKGRSE